MAPLDLAMCPHSVGRHAFQSSRKDPRRGCINAAQDSSGSGGGGGSGSAAQQRRWRQLSGERQASKLWFTTDTKGMSKYLTTTIAIWGHTHTVICYG